jgi:hypothetical protein|tara:strand:+ start:212 stop:589 length:378 start_codon:yes stop_codon:yes gene_type:complete
MNQISQPEHEILPKAKSMMDFLTQQLSSLNELNGEPSQKTYKTNISYDYNHKEMTADEHIAWVHAQQTAERPSHHWCVIQQHFSQRSGGVFNVYKDRQQRTIMSISDFEKRRQMKARRQKLRQGA